MAASVTLPPSKPKVTPAGNSASPRSVTSVTATDPPTPKSAASTSSCGIALVVVAPTECAVRDTWPVEFTLARLPSPSCSVTVVVTLEMLIATEIARPTSPPPLAPLIASEPSV